MSTRREQIVRAALELADEQGLNAVTRIAVASRVPGIGDTTVQYHFNPMSRLMDELLSLAIQENRDRVLAEALATRRLGASTVSPAVLNRVRKGAF